MSNKHSQWNRYGWLAFALAVIGLSFANWHNGLDLLGVKPETKASTESNTLPLPNLQGTAATEYLKQHGISGSLGEAMAAASYDVYEVSAQQRTADTDHYYENNPAQRWQARFSPERISLHPSSHLPKAWSVGVKLESIGYGECQHTVSAGRLSAQGDRIEYTRSFQSAINNQQSSITEWYVNRAEGLEQGFTLSEPPDEKLTSESLQLRLSVSGDLQAVAINEGNTILLRSGNGEVNYDHLVVNDSTGRKLHAQMRVKGNEITLLVNDYDANYPLTIDSSFTQQQKLTANDAAFADQFGWSVAISGETIIAGVPFPFNDGAPGNDKGSVYIFVKIGTDWVQQQKLTGDDTAIDDQFGYSVAINEGTIVVGAPYDAGTAGAYQGSVYVFVRNGSVWTKQQKLRASDAGLADLFGSLVDINGETLVVGVPDDGSPLLGSSHGSAYVFVRNGSIWTQQQKIIANDASANDLFGGAVSIRGDTIVAGAPFEGRAGSGETGSAYVFVRTGTTWTQQQKLTASDAANGDRFGATVGIAGETIVIGSPFDSVSASGYQQGSAYVFERVGSSWLQQQKLTANDAATEDLFGVSVGISSRIIVIGSAFSDLASRRDEGSAYVFVPDGSNWVQHQKLTANDARTADHFGNAVGISGNNIIIGALDSDGPAGVNQGSVYVFSRIAPTITCPGLTTVGIIETQNSASVPFNVTATGSPTPTVTCRVGNTIITSPHVFPVGTTTVNCTASNGVAPDASCSFTVTVNRVSGTANDPLACTGPGAKVQATLNISNDGQVNQNVVSNTTLTNLIGVPGSCSVTPNVGTCTVTTGGVSYSATLTPGQTVAITYLTQVSDLAPTGAQVCTNNSVSFNGGTPLNFSACDVVDCPAVGPGGGFPSSAEMSDQKAGGVLVYNIYTSSTDPVRQNTRINLTNAHSRLAAFVHLFFVFEGCSIADSYVCLTANQTTSFLTSDIDPGVTGFVVAVAVDSRGCPIDFNYLIGDEYVKFASGHAANLNAEAFASLPGGLPICDGSSVTAAINFDGINYNRAPRVLALSNVASRDDGNDTMLILNRIGGNLGIGTSSLGTLFGILYDEAENGLSFQISGACQLRNSLSNNFPRTAPRFETFIPAGRTGWIRLYSQSDIGMTGAAINFNPNVAASGGIFNQGHNLHALTLSGTNTYTIPVFPPSC